MKISRVPPTLEEHKSVRQPSLPCDSSKGYALLSQHELGNQASADY